MWRGKNKSKTNYYEDHSNHSPDSRFACFTYFLVAANELSVGCCGVCLLAREPTISKGLVIEHFGAIGVGDET